MELEQILYREWALSLFPQISLFNRAESNSF
jgi:hypothetical protein